jgi:aryl-alcohol dehydrogenase-like predicted oxidoreductase
MTDANYAFVDKLSSWARERGHTCGEAAQAWLLAHPEVSSVISGATRLEQLQENIKAADWSLSAAEVTEIEQLLT